MRTLARATVLVGMVVMVLLGTTTAQAHQWGTWHWDRYGDPVYIEAYTYGYVIDASVQAANDWSWNTILEIPQVGYHTHH